MRHKNSRKTVIKKRRAGGRWHLPSFQYGQRYVWLLGGHHAIYEQKPDEVGRIIVKFINELE